MSLQKIIKSQAKQQARKKQVHLKKKTDKKQNEAPNIYMFSTEVSRLF